MSTLLCNAVRTSLAFLVAPLVVPLICVLIASIEAWSRRVPAEPAPEWLTLVATFSGLYAYLPCRAWRSVVRWAPLLARRFGWSTDRIVERNQRS
jgi:hypothetical protein